MDIDELFVKFITSFDNYDLYDDTALLKSATKTYLHIKNYEFEQARKEFKKFMKIINEFELGGTIDLINPIVEIYNRIYIVEI